MKYGRNIRNECSKIIKCNFILSVLLFFVAVAPTGSVASDPVTTGEYVMTQSWSQETAFQRAYYIHVPEHAGKNRLPVFIFLHSNGGHALEAMRGFSRDRKTIASQYITVFPQGYRESWNIVAERSKADDCEFIGA